LTTTSSQLPRRLPLRATLVSSCVRPGTVQTITITSDPGVSVIYHATYSDGRTARDPGYYGGNEQGTTGATGTWKDSWLVAAGAPPGRVTVDVVATNGSVVARFQTSFSVAGATGACT
jgi:hypothetical protein